MKQVNLSWRDGSILGNSFQLLKMPICSKSAIIKATSNAFPSIGSNLLSLAKQTWTEILDDDLKHKVQKGMN